MKQSKQAILLCLLWMVGMSVNAEEIPNNEIWYTTNNADLLYPKNSFLDEHIVSNSYKDGKGVISFDCDVTSIDQYTFCNCMSLASIDIPNSVTTIGDSAFYRCKSLTSIKLPNSVTSIGEFAFCFCTSLTSIDIPNSLTYIGDYAFSNCM